MSGCHLGGLWDVVWNTFEVLWWLLVEIWNLMKCMKFIVFSMVFQGLEGIREVSGRHLEAPGSHLEAYWRHWEGPGWHWEHLGDS